MIPAAGNGTRLKLIKGCTPKELLYIGNKAMIEYAIAESYKANIKEVGIIIRKEKNIIKEFLDKKYKNLTYIYQDNPIGLGDAILKTKSWIDNKTFGVILPDEILISEHSGIGQLFKIYQKYNTSILAVKWVNNPSLYGIVLGDEISERFFKIKDLVEKPKNSSLKKGLGIIGRYVLTPEIFKCIHTLYPKSQNSEIELTNALKILLQKEDIYAVLVDGRRYDCGNKNGLEKAKREIRI